MAARLISHNVTEFHCTGGWTIWFSLLFKKGTWDENAIINPNNDLSMPVEQIIASFGQFIPFIKTKLDVVMYNAFPFNLLKGLVITAFTMLVYKRIRPLLKEKE